MPLPALLSFPHRSAVMDIHTWRTLVPVLVIIGPVRFLYQTKITRRSKCVVENQHPLRLDAILNGLHPIGVEKVQLALLVIFTRFFNLLSALRFPNIVGFLLISGVSAFVLRR